jgi:nucleoside-diphosphate-sugar epimerase
MKKQHLVITGSAGFIGGYMVQEALNQGFTVTGIDNLSKYGQAVRNFDSNPNYRLVNGDATDVDLLEEYFSEADHVIAGAAMIGGISYFHTFAYDLLATNERIMAATCDAAIKALKIGRLKKVTYLSSSMVFESAQKWPSFEGDELNSPPPLSSYGFQKLAVEYFAKAAWDQYKLPYTILRPFNCVGIGEQKAQSDVRVMSGNIQLAMSHVVPDLIQKVLKGQNPVHILGSGSQERCYTYGGDLAKAIIGSLNNENALNNDFNLSTPKSHTVMEILELIWSKTNKNGEKLAVVNDAPFEFDVQKRIPNVDKARELLGFEATTTLSEMLDELIPWIENAIERDLI